jgi:hypothetical protein
MLWEPVWLERFLPLLSPLPIPKKSGDRERTDRLSAVPMIALYVVFALLAGALVTLQTGSNARLKEALGQAIPAVVISSVIGVLLLVMIILVTRTSMPAARPLRTARLRAPRRERRAPVRLPAAAGRDRPHLEVLTAMLRTSPTATP